MLVRDVYNEKTIGREPTRNGYGAALVELGRKNKNIVVLTGDLAESTRAQMFQAKYPERFFDVGVAEQNMMGVAAGLALTGKIPFVSSYAVFSPGRNWDQLRVSVCYSRANVKIIGAHTGLSVGPDGATHQALEDIAITRCLPNLTVIAPCDVHETKKAIFAAAKIAGPVYIRLAREATPAFTTPNTDFQVGRADILRRGHHVSIIGCGPILYEALQAAHSLSQEGIEAEVINCHTIKPIDHKTIIASAKKTEAVVTVEEHQIIGGLGSAVAEVLSAHYPVPLKMIGVRDTFGESGTPNELMIKYGLDRNQIIDTVRRMMKSLLK
ncbi:TPA: transketolase [Candidatus Falkowbacteria bacterium]|nr:transketolase [Candidatus Falkowbacteria bacterium]